MKKIIKNTILGTSLIFLGIACTGNFEDYNTNHYQIHKADPSTLMKSMIETIVNIQQNDSQMFDQMVGQLGGYFTCSNVWSGTNFGTFNQSDAWNATPWNNSFEKIYGNYFQVEEATDASGHFYAFARMIRAINMLRVADTYGPMPYSQVKKGNFYVAYDTEEEVYRHILEDLSNAADVLYNFHVETNGVTPLGANDPVYNGNYAAWARLANSMRLRVSIRISHAFPQMAQENAEAATSHSAGLIEVNSDNALLSCGSQTNPYQLATVSWGDLRVNANIVDYMRAYKDPRMSKYFNHATFSSSKSEYIGMRSGEDGFKKDAVKGYSTAAIAGTSPLLVFCAAETAFLLAEARLNNWSVGKKKAKDYYEEGIRLSMEQHGVAMNDAYLTNKEKPHVIHDNDPRGKLYQIRNTVCVAWGEDDEENLQRIITQKWIANYPLGLEAWAEYRRTGYPELYPCLDNLSNSGVSDKYGMRRLRYPYTEKQNNKTNNQIGVSYLSTGNDTETTDLIWAKKTY